MSATPEEDRRQLARKEGTGEPPAREGPAGPEEIQAPVHAPEEEEAGEDQAYFLAIEEIFVQLRGAPLLLSPGDWRVAQRWHRQGMPLDVVRRAMEEVFARRAERGAKGRISSLRYVAPAIEAAWGELRDLAAPGERDSGAALDLAARLQALAGALPEDLPGREELASRIAGLAVARSGDSEAVESALSALDAEMLEAAERALDEDARSGIAAAVERTLGALAGRLDATEIERARARLDRQILRQRRRLPVLSLFSPEARAGEGR